MKNKILVLIFGLTVLIAVNFSTAKNDNENPTEFNIAKLISLNTANAEESGGETICKCNIWGKCTVSGTGVICASYINGFCDVYDSDCI